MFRVDMDTKDFDEKQQRLFVKLSAPERLRFHRRVGVLMLAMEREIFDTNGAALLGNPWKPLSPVTVKIRQRKAKTRAARAMGVQILRDSGLLYASIGGGTPDVGPQDGIRRVTPSETIIGTNRSYAWKHQYGAPESTENVPRQYRKQYYRRNKKTGKRVRVVGHLVKAHTKRVPKIDPRPFAGWTMNAVARLDAMALDHLRED